MQSLLSHMATGSQQEETLLRHVARRLPADELIIRGTRTMILWLPHLTCQDHILDECLSQQLPDEIWQVWLCIT